MQTRKRLRVEGLESRLVLSAVPLSSVPELSSDPSSPHKIYLDFDGHVTTNTSWNNFLGGADIHSKAYDFDGDSQSFSEAELDSIRAIWEIVSEDFAPFDVDVTTIEPDELPGGLSKFEVGGEALRVVFSDRVDTVTGAEWYSANVSGVARFDAWGFTSDTPVWVFRGGGQETGSIASNETAGEGNVASHEVGHAFGLRHDGDASNTYHAGHDVAELGMQWRPIMGDARGLADPDRELYQWSKGEYTGATNGPIPLQDDIALIAAQVGFREDDHKGQFDLSLATAATQVGGNLLADGVIATPDDKDVFSFSVVSPQTLALEASPSAARGPNLDVGMRLIDSQGMVVAESSPASSLSARIYANLGAGDYFVEIDGVGLGTPDTGYSDYGSLGRYKIDGRLSENPEVFRVDQSPSTESNDRLIRFAFNKDVSASLSFDDLQVARVGEGPVDLTGAGFDSALGEWDLDSLQLPTGQYEATLSAAGVFDTDGRLLDGDLDGVPGGDYAFNFEVWQPGDANLDGFVDALDLAVVESNSGAPANFRADWGRGNFNEDTIIGNADRSIWFANASFIGVASGQGFLGDFTMDGTVDAEDIDFLYRGINATFADQTLYAQVVVPSYDINQDGLLDQADVDYLVFNLIGTVYGDTSLDGRVDGNDFGVLVGNLGNNVSSWAQADFNGDGVVDNADFGILNGNWGYGT